MKKIKLLLTILSLLILLSITISAQTDQVKYVPRYTDPLLKQMDTTRDSLKAIEDSISTDIREQQEKKQKDKDEKKKTLRFDFTGVTKPASPDVFKTAFHFPPVPQYYTGTCWAFAGISFLESETARLTGRRIKLSEMYIVYYEYLEKCRNFIVRRGDFYVSEGSETNAVLRIIKKYGLVPRAYFTGYINDEKFDHTTLSEEIRTYLDYLKAKNCWDEKLMQNSIKLILNKYMGEPPVSIEFEGRTMTPLEFARDILSINPDDYTGVTSTLAQPFYKWGELEVEDNWWHDSTYYNLPLDEWYQLMKQATTDGYTVTLGGDVSEPGYNGFEDAAIVPDFDIPQAYINQDAREFRLYNETTGDEHGIHLVGYCQTDKRDWFLIKDSSRSGRWGKFEGYYFYRDDYIRLKMIFYMIHRDALKSFINDINESTKEN